MKKCKCNCKAVSMSSVLCTNASEKLSNEVIQELAIPDPIDKEDEEKFKTIAKCTYECVDDLGNIVDIGEE